MLNPSTADAQRDDPTIRRCTGFARRWGFGGIEVVNLFAWRATKPEELRRASDPVGRLNDRAILRAARECAMTIAAWGNHGAWMGRTDRVLEILRGVCEVRVFGLTAIGQPKHPLYLSRRCAAVPMGSRYCAPKKKPGRARARVSLIDASCRCTDS